MPARSFCSTSSAATSARRSRAYASAYLDPSSPLYVDAVTASPYLGVGSLAPMFELAAEHGGGVFVLALTSNPEGAAVQRAARPTAAPWRRP